MKKRTKKIEIMVSLEEYEALLQKKTKARLAEWMRETCLNQQIQKQILTVNPLLLYELNKIGINLNQIARKVNQSSHNIEWLIQLTNIEKQLARLLNHDY